MQLESRTVDLDNILLDPNNYRFRDKAYFEKVEEVDFIKDEIQERTKNFLIGEKNRKENISDLISSFKTNGYLPVEMIQVRPIKETNKYLVIEGNRRVAALKELKSELSKGNNIGKITKEFFSEVPVILYNDENVINYYTLMGLKHIGGNKKWELVNQAELIQDFIKAGHDEKKIAENLGITLHRVRRSRRAFALIEEYKLSDYSDQFNSSMYNIFDEIATRTAVKDWLDWGLNDSKPKNKNNLDRLFSWISITEKANAKDQDFKRLPSVINTGDDIRLLSFIVTDAEKLLQLDQKSKSIEDIVKSSNENKRIKFISQSIIDLIEDLKPFAESVYKIKIKEELSNLHEIVTQCIDTGIKSHLIEARRLSENKNFNFKLDTVSIIHFKKFKDLTLKKINKVNIIAGKNNSGKTTILEAIYLLIKQNDVNAIYDIVSKRAKLTQSIPVKLLVQMMNQKIEINGNSDIKFSLSFELENNKDINLDGYKGSIFLNTQFQTLFYSSKTILNSIHGNMTTSEKINEIAPAVYTSPFISHTLKEVSLAYNSTIEKKGLYNRIIEFLRKVDGKILEIRLNDDELRRFIVEYKDFETPLDISQFGEGFQRIFYISLQFALASGGVLLIDEVENAIHHSLFKNFAEFIYLVSKEFSVQVFMTSHSKEAIDTFIIDKFLDQLSVYHLKEENENIVCKYASGAEFKKLVNSINLDLRGEN